MASLGLWKALVEILILAGCVYLVLRFLEGSRGAAVLRGAVLALGGAWFVLRFVAERFDLSVVKLVVNYVGALAAIALIVIFQPDLRRAMIRLGGSSFFHFMSRGQTSVVDEIVAAVEKMASQRVGALVAIEREVGLKAYIEGGAQLDANVGSELLQTLFHPNAPLSDGAVVIHESRVVAAGCLFPLTESPGLSPELGTRHRAGIGITEESDAIAVIVSEERGEIALAVRGQIHRPLDSAQLARLLRQLQAERPIAPAQQTDRPVEVNPE